MSRSALIMLVFLAGCDGGDDCGGEAGGTCGPGGAEGDGGTVTDFAVADVAPGDAAPVDAAPLDAQVDAQVDAGMSSGTVCSFNRECPDNERCLCDEVTGCACTIGPRGTGVAGEPCTTGDDCASAVCLEGPNDDLVCTEECEDETTCPANLPQCLPIAFVGQVCVRQAPPG